MYSMTVPKPINLESKNEMQFLYYLSLSLLGLILLSSLHLFSSALLSSCHFCLENICAGDSVFVILFSLSFLPFTFPSQYFFLCNTFQLHFYIVFLLPTSQIFPSLLCRFFPPSFVAFSLPNVFFLCRS